MSQKKIKQARSKKHTVRELLASLEWSVNGDRLELFSPITNEFVTISIEAIIKKQNG